MYRTHEDGSRTALIITRAGLAAIGIEPDVQRVEADETAARKPARGRKASPGRGKGADRAAPQGRSGARHSASGRHAAGTKQSHLIAMLERNGGATIAQIVDATGCCPHGPQGHLGRAKEISILRHRN